MKNLGTLRAGFRARLKKFSFCTQLTVYKCREIFVFGPGNVLPVPDALQWKYGCERSDKTEHACAWIVIPKH